MAISEGFNINPDNRLDIGTPNLPHFRYTEEERNEKLESGMTDEQITAEEISIAGRIRENQDKKAA